MPARLPARPLRPRFAPLFRGEPLAPGLDPFDKAVAAAMMGAEPGLIVWSEDLAAMRAAVLLAPDMPLSRAVGVSFAALLGFSDAFGALAPPEVAVHFDWPAGIRVNGARCGRLRAAAAPAAAGAGSTGADAPPDWLVLGLSVPIMPLAVEPGETPDRTTLHDEGCADIAAPQLIEAWSRHMLVWINRFLDDGLAPLHAAWREKCDRLGAPVETPAKGVFVGLDELGGMLLRTPEGTRVLPLADLLDEAP